MRTLGHTWNVDDEEQRTLPELLGTDEGAGIEFEPERVGLTARAPDLNS